LTSALIAREDPAPSLPQSSFAPLAGTLLSYGQNEIIVQIKTPAPGIAVLNETTFPGWRATVNGQERQLFRANHLMRAVVVPAGSSTLRFYYRPIGYLLSLGGFILALSLLLFCLAEPLFGRWRA
jgi:uncharacterized membrane protein YfhO